MGRTSPARQAGLVALIASIALFIVGFASPAHAANDATVDAAFTCETVEVTSSKNISNVVVRFADGSTERFEGLSGRTWSRAFDREIAGVWVKSGNNKSGDGPGYGQRFDSDADCGDGGQTTENASQDADPAPSVTTENPTDVREAPVRVVEDGPATTETAAAEETETGGHAVQATASTTAAGTAVLGVAMERPVTAAGPDTAAAGVQAEAAPSSLAVTGAEAGWLLGLAIAFSVYGIVALDLTGRRAEG